MKQRLITGVIAGAVFLGLLFAGGIYFQALVGFLAVIAVSELFRMRGLQFRTIEGILASLATLALVLPLRSYFPKLASDSQLMLFTFFIFSLLVGMVFSNGRYTFENIGFTFLSSFYVGIGFENLLNARQAGMFTVLYAIFVVWATDIGAYAVGRRIGRNKLIPSVSPNKTIEGSLGGIVCAVLVGLIMFGGFSKYAPSIPMLKVIIFTIIFSIVAQMGDLVESSIKRQYGVKDSGTILPGHGGILDRFDSMIFVFPVMHLLGLF